MDLFEEQVLDVLDIKRSAPVWTQSRTQVSDATALDQALTPKECYLSDMSHISADSGAVHEASYAHDACEHAPQIDVLDLVLEQQTMEDWGLTGELERFGQSPPVTTAEQPRPAKPTGRVRKRTTLRPIPEPKQFKRWKNATPSKYCHCCGSAPRGGERAACKNIEKGTCRKVFCRPCIEKIYGRWRPELMTEPWECTHCAGACPVKASCRYYTKTNSKRLPKAFKVEPVTPPVTPRSTTTNPYESP